ncbi:hypothetical protein ABT075_02280 [Streptomyces sp. NPDC002677]|uniref:hypothetical protein n=1 Tax=Streptomyces sp. NPDC002677 TaxID=3154774 RepID=UPI00331AC949
MTTDLTEYLDEAAAVPRLAVTRVGVTGHRSIPRRATGRVTGHPDRRPGRRITFNSAL